MNPAHNLILIGAMGAGKTTLGRRVALHFGLDFVDLDAEIEAHTGAPVPLIFDLEGEPGFRRREAALLAEHCARRGILLATGGGAVLDDANRALLQRHGFVVWLQTRVEQQLRRLARDKQRPLLAADDRRERLEALARARDPLYRGIADLIVPPHDDPPQRTAARVAALIESHWQQPPCSTEAA